MFKGSGLPKNKNPAERRKAIIVFSSLMGVFLKTVALIYFSSSDSKNASPPTANKVEPPKHEFEPKGDM